MTRFLFPVVVLTLFLAGCGYKLPNKPAKVKQSAPVAVQAVAENLSTVGSNRRGLSNRGPAI